MTEEMMQGVKAMLMREMFHYDSSLMDRAGQSANASTLTVRWEVKESGEVHEAALTDAAYKAFLAMFGLEAAHRDWQKRKASKKA